MDRNAQRDDSHATPPRVESFRHNPAVDPLGKHCFLGLKAGMLLPLVPKTSQSPNVG